MNPTPEPEWSSFRWKIPFSLDGAAQGHCSEAELFQRHSWRHINSQSHGFFNYKEKSRPTLKAICILTISTSFNATHTIHESFIQKDKEFFFLIRRKSAEGIDDVRQPSKKSVILFTWLVSYIRMTFGFFAIGRSGWLGKNTRFLPRPFFYFVFVAVDV